jgi:hypothetical protein
VTAYDSALSALHGHLGELETALALWESRDDTKAQPAVRQAANDAIDAIDAALRELHGVRAQLVGEIRVSDDATAVRAADLLARVRHLRQAACPNHRPVLDDVVGWYCPACGSDAPPDAGGAW